MLPPFIILGVLVFLTDYSCFTASETITMSITECLMLGAVYFTYLMVIIIVWGKR